MVGLSSDQMLADNMSSILKCCVNLSSCIRPNQITPHGVTKTQGSCISAHDKIDLGPRFKYSNFRLSDPDVFISWNEDIEECSLVQPVQSIAASIAASS